MPAYTGEVECLSCWRKQKAVPFKKERGGGGSIVKQRTTETGKVSNSRSHSVACPNKTRDEVCTGSVSAGG